LAGEGERTRFFAEGGAAADLPFFEGDFFDDFFCTADRSAPAATPPAVRVGRVRPDAEISPPEDEVISEVAGRRRGVFFFGAILQTVSEQRTEQTFEQASQST